MDLFKKVESGYLTILEKRLMIGFFEECKFDKVISLYVKFLLSGYWNSKEKSKTKEYLNVKFYVGVSNFYLKNFNNCYLDLTYFVENIENIESEVNYKIKDACFYICCSIQKSIFLFTQLSYSSIKHTFDRAISLNPKSIVLYHLYLSLDLSSNNIFINKYLNLLSQRIEKDKINRHYYHKIRGDLYFKLFEYEKALKDYLKVVNLISNIQELHNFRCVFSKNFRINTLNTNKIPFLYQKICFCCLEKPTPDFGLFKKYYALLQQFKNKEFVIVMLVKSLNNSYIKKLKRKIFQKMDLEKW